MFFVCDLCDYKTCHRGHYNRHSQTVKHRRLLMANIQEMKGQPDISHVCSCGKAYNHATSLSRHRKNCDYEMVKKGISVPKNLRDNKSPSKTEKSENDTKKNVIVEKKDESIDFKTLFLNMMNENKELQNKLLELAKEPKIINNNNQKTINIIQFLNEDCKDAMNLSDFLKNLVVTFEDLEKIEEYGYLMGIKKSLLQSLHKMEKTKRPIHCTDIKRKQFYVKDDNKWEKDMSQNKINDAIGQYNTNQMQMLSEWKKKNPEWIKNGTQQDKVNRMNKELTSLYSFDGKKLKNKIITEIGCITNVLD